MSDTSFNSEKVRDFIKKNMVVFEEDDVDLKDDTNIFKAGFVNSMFAFQLLTFLEAEFKVAVGDEDVVLINFASIDAMRALVERIQGVNEVA